MFVSWRCCVIRHTSINAMSSRLGTFGSIAGATVDSDYGSQSQITKMTTTLRFYGTLRNSGILVLSLLCSICVFCTRRKTVGFAAVFCTRRKTVGFAAVFCTRRKTVRVAVVVCLSLIALFYSKWNTPTTNDPPGRDKDRETGPQCNFIKPIMEIKENPIIIYVNNPAHWLNDWIGSGWESSTIFKPCPVSNCVLSKDKENICNSHAVLIRPFDFRSSWKKKLGQVWILMEHEAPTSFDYPPGRNIKPHHNNLFNWTFTYRRDSDFTLEHGYFKKRSQEFDSRSLERSIKSKTKSAVGFISNCGVSSKRDFYVKKLRQSGLDLDIFGTCGNLKCRGDNRHKTSWNTSGAINTCFDVMNTKYKFYLSFENSICVDYVTEKSLNLIMSRDIVPVIRDGVNHSLFHPPGSYIHTRDYSSPQQLTEFLLGIAKNETKYREYFKWRKYYTIQGIIDVLQRNFCEICKRLHNPEKYHRIYNDIGKFMWYGEKQACFDANDL
ncbi:4-galactosyl-N-acetylglucosaminide 3-alpha-L-fucosyltransferase 9-like isoform X2 [Argopecten irradians]|uniref:4-galactosyl-N-acetylglucosaminide 3-alpha-L-fucosyltransferase 9-like isoform X2 n=1 Tax=Argopecten irradians TaxID=31199 RepID=UPI0037101977